MANRADISLPQAPLHLKFRQNILFPLLTLTMLHPIFPQGPEGEDCLSLHYKDA